MDTPSFRTIVPVETNPSQIGLQSALASFGSCFAENIAGKLRDHRFSMLSNPTGALYNPFSVCSAIERIIAGNRYEKDELFEHEGFWKCFDHHSSFDARDRTDFLRQANDTLLRARAALKQATCVILTFGTAFVYRLRDSERIVANCHRLPHKNFTRRLADIESMVTACGKQLNNLLKLPHVTHIIVTVSPVRHLRDKPHENSVSKAHLLAAIHVLQRQFPSLYYFPAYEILLDELRDYRFYADDMTHPSAIAVDYIWQRFLESNLDDDARGFVEEYAPIRRGRSHRQTRKHTKRAADFATGMLARIEELCSRYPALSLDEDKRYFRSLL